MILLMKFGGIWFAGDPEFCPTTLQLAGSCGLNAAFDCFEAIDEKHGASAMTQRCSCKDLSANEHLCQCYIVCQWLYFSFNLTYELLLIK